MFRVIIKNIVGILVFILSMNFKACFRQADDYESIKEDKTSISLSGTENKKNINVAEFLLPELIWEIGSESPQPVDFFDPSAVGMAEGLEESAIEAFVFDTPVTEEMLLAKKKYVIKLHCNGITIEGHLSMVDTTPPVIIVPEQQEYEVNDTIFYKRGVEVKDNSGEDLTLMVDSSNVKSNIAGTYYVYYSAVDSAGNKGEAVSEIVIKENHVVSEEEVNCLADELLEELVLDDMNQVEKLKAIFDWCYSNIRYTVDADKSSLYKGAYDGIYYRAGDCYTYYATAAWLMDRCGITNIPVSRQGEHATHYWSLVKTDMGWYHFDCSPHKGGYQCFLQTDEQVRKYAEENERDADYFRFDEEERPERSKKVIYCNDK